MEALYCPDCDVKLVVKDLENHILYCCTNCGKIFAKHQNKIRFIYQTSGNNSMRELFTFIDSMKNKDCDI